MRTLTIEPLSRAAFAVFGDVIELDGAAHFPINLGTTERYHDLAGVDVADAGGRPLINVFRGEARTLPFAVTMLERHPLGSQAFIPLDARPYLIVVAPAGELMVERIRAFVSRGWQGVNYAKGVWHHPLLSFGERSDFVVIDRGGEGLNLHEQDLPEIVWLTADTLERASGPGT
jgi:ureidoglycolate lyase